MFVGTRWVGGAIWALLSSIFLFDVLTPAENISVCFAYAIPVFLSLFEARPRPFLYACTATLLSFVGSFIQPPSDLGVTVVAANRLIAVATQWLAAMLVRLQYQRHYDAQHEAELQRRFIDILSHEIGTALTTITGHAYRLAKLSERPAPDDLKLRADKIRGAARRIEEIVDRVQFASSLGDGTIPVGADLVDVGATIRTLAAQFGEESEREPIALDLPAEPQLVRGDETLLRQAFENVIANSVKYSPRDGGILVGVAPQGSVVRVTVADRGSGIPGDEIVQVRQPYYRGRSSKGTSGAGLGLYFVERIVAAHRGELHIESEVDRGTRVVIDLPRSVVGP